MKESEYVIVATLYQRNPWPSLTNGELRGVSKIAADPAQGMLRDHSVYCGQTQHLAGNQRNLLMSELTQHQPAIDP